MLNLTRASSILSALLLTSQIAACGQKGPLYLPPEPGKPAQSTSANRTAPASQPATPAAPAASVPASK